ncbi:MAG: DNA translocase FtsK 4TM domain-containing protein, partial [Bacillota bacterium]
MSKKKDSKEIDEDIIEKRKNEILGILLFALGIFSGLSIFTGTTGMVGELLSDFYLKIAGVGSYLFPLFIVIWGIALIRLKKIQINSRVIGFFIAYIMILAIIHIYNYPVSPLELGLESRAGGLIGGSISWIFSKLFGITGAYIISGAFLLIGILLWLDVLLHSIIKALTNNINKIVVKLFHKLVNYYNKIKNKLSGIYSNSVKNEAEEEFTNNEKSEVVDTDTENETTTTEVQEYYYNNIDEEETEEELDKVEDDLEQIIDLSQKGNMEEAAVSDENIEMKKNDSEEDKNKEKNDIYRLPPLKLLKSSGKKKVKLDNKSDLLEDTLSSFGVEARVKEVSHGPKITRYEIQPDTGVKVSKIVNLADDIALALAAPDVRIEAPIPGKAAIGIEVPHSGNIFVRTRDIISSGEYKSSKSKLTLALGKGIDGQPMVADLSKMPHLLVAGATGSGKSVCINSFITSLLYKATPDDLKLILVDPKKVELSNYKGLPHLFTPVVTDPKKASNVLKLVVDEMEGR